MRPWFQRASQATTGGPPAQNPASGKGSWEGTLWGHPSSFEGLPGSLNLSTGLCTCTASLRSQHLYLRFTKGQVPLRRGPGHLPRSRREQGTELALDGTPSRPALCCFRPSAAPISTCLALLAGRPQKPPCWMHGPGGICGSTAPGGSPDVLPVEQAEEAERHHVPVGTVVVTHQVEGQGHV